MKMPASMLVAFGRSQIVHGSGIPAYLNQEDNRRTSPANCDVEPIPIMRPPLSHAIYAELGEVSYAIVLIFGFLKIYVPLAHDSQANDLIRHQPAATDTV